MRLLQTLSLCLLCGLAITACGQSGKEYPVGILIDPSIQKAGVKAKEVNTFKTERLINGKPVENDVTGGLMQIPLMSVSSFDKSDTLLTFIGMLVPYGFQIQISGDSIHVKAFVSSRSCECFKEKLSDPRGYGAGAKANNLTLVANKLHDLKKGDVVFGYIKFNSDELYHFINPRDDKNYETWKFNYEGYFKVDIK